MYSVTEKGRKFYIAQYKIYAPRDGIRNPRKSRQFQFLTLMASFNVTTMITLV